MPLCKDWLFFQFHLVRFLHPLLSPTIPHLLPLRFSNYRLIHRLKKSCNLIYNNGKIKWFISDVFQKIFPLALHIHIIGHLNDSFEAVLFIRCSAPIVYFIGRQFCCSQYILSIESIFSPLSNCTVLIQQVGILIIITGAFPKVNFIKALQNNWIRGWFSNKNRIHLL